MKKSTDFTRDVVALFGIPFDVLGHEAAEQRVLDAMATGRKLFMSTPNLNFVALCQRDEVFRQSVLISDLSVVDGAGVMLLGKLMGTPMPERIAGSTLFDNLVRRAPRALKVFLFGGDRGVAKQAADKLNERTAADTAVGYLTPGFGDVASLTEPGQLDEIRSKRPNFLLVALGAQKGQRWILENWDQLPSCVVSHLGATINFIAGSVVRAPLRIQRLGLEWAWRIKEEPRLWQRYAGDAWAIGRTLTSQWLARFIVEPMRLRGGAGAPEVALLRTADGFQLQLSGRWRRDDGLRLAHVLEQATQGGGGHAVVALKRGCRLDPYIVGKLLLLVGHQAATLRTFKLHAEEPALLRSLRRQGLRDVPTSVLTPAQAPLAPSFAVPR